MHVGRRDHLVVRQAAGGIHTDMHLYAEMPLVTLFALMHLRVARLTLILDRGWCGDQHSVHDSAFLEQQVFLLRC